MQLKKLQISGFKSFGKSAVLEFFHPISAIVGPNGSGKSNVAEAVAWVLGEQSLKSLRGKKGEDLIFNGSPVVPKTGKASVLLTFSGCGTSGGFGEEISVSRVVYRDGANEYFLDNTRCRLKDIVELLGKMGIGASRHHIISQGEADRILIATPKERKEMVEDALGLRIFQLKKEESLRKLQNTGGNINQAELLQKEIQPHLRFLKKQVDKARQSLSFKEKLKELCSSYFSKADWRLRNDSEAVVFKKQEAESGLSSAEKKIAELKQRLSEFAKEKEKIQKVRERVSYLEREIGRYEGMISQAKNFSFVTPQKAERRVSVDFKEIKLFLDAINKEIDRAISEIELTAIKNILNEMKDKNTSFLAAYDYKAKDTEKNEPRPDPREELEKKFKEMAVSLEEAKKEEERIFKGSEESMALERELYQNEIRIGELKGRLSVLSVQEDDFRFRKQEFEDEKAEARALLKEDIVFKEAGEFDRSEIEKERREIERYKIKLEESGSVGEEIIKEYQEVSSRDEFLGREIEDLNKTAGSLKDLIKQLEEKLDADFKNGLGKINEEFQGFFEVMFGGGEAELKIVTAPKKKRDGEESEKSGEETLEEEMEEGLPAEVAAEQQAEEGLDVKVNLPRKRIKSLDSLSGGERALTSIALLFALSQVNPPPFLILDETDAALDEANSRKYAKMLKDLSERTQLILITHNRETMNSAGILYGVTMGSDGVSRLLSVKLEEAAVYVR